MASAPQNASTDHVMPAVRRECSVCGILEVFMGEAQKESLLARKNYSFDWAERRWDFDEWGDSSSGWAIRSGVMMNRVS